MSGGAYPVAAGTYERPYNVELRGFSPKRRSTAQSLKLIVRSRGAHRWYLKLSYGPMYRPTWEEIVSFLDEQFDGAKFTIVVPGKETPRGAWAAAPQVNGAQAAGVTTVNLKNFGAGAANVVRRGDIFTFASHLKVYSATRDANADGAGHATVYLSSPLMTAIVDGSAVTKANVTMQCSVVDDNVPRTLKGGLVCPGFEVAMVEDPY